MTSIVSTIPTTLNIAPSPMDAPPKVIINAFSAGGVATAPILGDTTVKVIASGALTAATLKTILTLTGSGVLKILAIYSADTTSRTLRGKLTIDGVVAFDATSTATVTLNNGMIIVGSLGVTGIMLQDSIAFASSVLFEVASSLTETDKIGTYTNYHTN